jgi:hypothetical protein
MMKKIFGSVMLAGALSLSGAALAAGKSDSSNARAARLTRRKPM